MRTGGEDDCSMNFGPGKERTCHRYRRSKASAGKHTSGTVADGRRSSGFGRPRRLLLRRPSYLELGANPRGGLRWHDQVPQRRRFDLPNESNLGAYDCR